MSRPTNRQSDYLLATAEHEGASLFPSGLFMYDLPSLRRTASRTPNNAELSTQELPEKQSSSPSPSVGLIKIEIFQCFRICLVFIIIIFNCR